MKSLIQISESLRILFIRSNLQTRMAMVFCTALLAVGLGLLVQNANLLSNRMEYLLDGQDFAPEQLDQFELAFSGASLRNYERVGNRMRVPSNSKDAYLKALAQAKCLPVRLEQDIAGSSDPLRFLEPRIVAQERERKERIMQIQNTLKTCSDRRDPPEKQTLSFSRRTQEYPETRPHALPGPESLRSRIGRPGPR
jgi:hypothetical protein